ncbi:putative quinol monooxygenase [Algicola sagamiensis]|uniref:putative quinol monooxygenase n=1 Tax=Algicola sagamiensis TaxID=163869 RepID=UPI0003706BFB|nr:putative quinol monooxygenase [Algicola sagamiensis]
MAHLTIVAQITAKPHKAELVKTELEKLLEITRKEEGCLQYELHQDNTNPAFFLFFEQWTNRALWQKHMASAHIQHYISVTEDAVETFALNEMTKIE